MEQKIEGEYRAKHTDLLNHSEEIAFYNYYCNQNSTLNSFNSYIVDFGSNNYPQNYNIHKNILGKTLLAPFKAVSALVRKIPGVAKTTKAPIKTSPKGVPVKTKVDKPAKVKTSTSKLVKDNVKKGAKVAGKATQAQIAKKGKEAIRKQHGRKT